MGEKPTAESDAAWCSLWKKFGVWCDEEEKKLECPECGRGESVCWGEQMDKIEELVMDEFGANDG